MKIYQEIKNEYHIVTTIKGEYKNRNYEIQFTFTGGLITVRQYIEDLGVTFEIITKEDLIAFNKECGRNFRIYPRPDNIYSLIRLYEMLFDGYRFDYDRKYPRSWGQIQFDIMNEELYRLGLQLAWEEVSAS